MRLPVGPMTAASAETDVAEETPTSLTRPPLTLFRDFNLVSMGIRNKRKRKCQKNYRELLNLTFNIFLRLLLTTVPRYTLPLVDIFGVVFCSTRLLSVGNTDCGAGDK